MIFWHMNREITVAVKRVLFFFSIFLFFSFVVSDFRCFRKRDFNDNREFVFGCFAMSESVLSGSVASNDKEAGFIDFSATI